ncbi:hypothetical protein [Bacillus sp. FJAT-26390]|uniref:hypothetical protein n=1 Tax=Bacillus sp. FJAT-26390 TaxID=1743142 RepID=UPI0008080EBE|nr:hypothetical protein [Bacillus sp. FJAT-26390]OBZ08710.1 hypothetical protein A7975_26950 [Bacillus sp. FJAT-26390]
MSGKRKHPVLNVAQHLLYTFRWTFFFYWIIFILVFIGLAVLVNEKVIPDGELNLNEIWESVTISPKIFLMVIGILLTPASLASFVACGVTRRHFIRGVTLFMAASSALLAILMMAGISVEQFIYERNNWSIELQNAHLFTSPSQLGLVFVEYFCLFFAYFGSGWLIGSGYYRFHWRNGLLITLVAIVTAVAMDIVLTSKWLGELLQSAFNAQHTPVAAVVLLAILVIAIIVVLNDRILRRVAIKKKMF